MEALILSTRLDTNGQNTRYVRASEKHGADPHVLRVFAVGKDDPAGVVERFRAAAEKSDGLRIRSANQTTNYLDFPRDIVWDRRNPHSDALVRELAQQADVIHLNNSYQAMLTLGLRKPALLHHHGSLFRDNPARMLQAAKAFRMVQAVSTIDLQRHDPAELHWLPTAYDVEVLAHLRQKRDNDIVRIVHAPTNRELKHTRVLTAAVDELVAEGLPVELVLVEGVTWDVCLAVKATADIVFDQLAWGYGCNAVEAWSMGIPVVSGADDWTTQRMSDMWGYLPYVPTTEGGLAHTLRVMVGEPGMRRDWGGIGYTHVKRFHDERPALAVLAELYEKAIRRYSAWHERCAAEPVTFRNTSKRNVYVDGDKVEWADGTISVSDPFVIERLRYFARKRPLLGIEEVA